VAKAQRLGIVTETAYVSTETLRFMSIMVAVNCALAALGVAIAYYVYFYFPHSVEVHYTGKYGEVVSSAATYAGVFPAFQVWIFVVSVIGRWGANRRHFLREEFKGWQQPTDQDLLYKSVSFFIAAVQLIVLTMTAYRAVLLATHSA
jgi:hypothetical protein